MIRRALPIAVLVAVAAVCGALSYRAFSHRAAKDHWAPAIASAQRAERTKAVLPATRLRRQAIGTLAGLARSGSAASRSHAELLSGMLLIRIAASDGPRARSLMIEAAGAFSRAIRLDPTNDDAAYDLELLLARARAAGRPLPATTQHRPGASGKPGSNPPGTGY